MADWFTTSFRADISSPLFDYCYFNAHKGDSIPARMAVETATRIGCAICVPLDIISLALDGAHGFTASALSLLTLGTRPGLYVKARTHLKSFGNGISDLFRDVLGVINPHFTMNYPEIDGIITPKLTRKLLAKAIACIQPNHDLFDKQVRSRLYYAASLIGTIVGRILDFIIGLIATPFALLTCGTVDWLNDKAYQGLKILRLCDDIYFHLIRIINPYAGVQPLHDHSKGNVLVGYSEITTP